MNLLLLVCSNRPPCSRPVFLFSFFLPLTRLFFSSIFLSAPTAPSSARVSYSPSYGRGAWMDEQAWMAFLLLRYQVLFTVSARFVLWRPLPPHQLLPVSLIEALRMWCRIRASFLILLPLVLRVALLLWIAFLLPWIVL